MNKPLQIFGNGMQIRDFVSVNDVVNSIYHSIENGKNQTYNIASGNSITIKQLAKLLINLSKKDIKIVHNDEKKGDIRFSEADITLAKNEIGYRPKFGLNQIKNMLE